MKYFKILRWIRKWIELFEAIIGILSLGFYNPAWTFNFLAWQTKLKRKEVK